ncbi:MAG: arsenosugar biosynthesis radical SAM protein ArsS [Saprospiraceae bacterium]|nr:arsenosugar biosynthesis radical SAM protein ArsS [Saprospiraceae bacterium]MDW8230677.1 arsenosugar biosynthesis radical SAM protein ArsS [Saprospiraceae bacterium]
MSIHPRTQTLARRHSPLSDTFFQLDVLNGRAVTDTKVPLFAETIRQAGYTDGVLTPTRIEIFQVNVGKLCNQTCAHCHVDAGPDRKRENMSKETFDLCLDVLRRYDIPTVDITGGAPEMNPHFRWFVEQCRALGKHVMDRCNLTIILAHERYRDLPQFFAQHQVEVVSSLPHYNARRTDSQRGDGVFEASIEALRLLNEVGYGQPDSNLKINLVYNPTGTFLPGNQEALEREFKAQLQRRYGIVFNRLYAITNMPISRFLDYLLESGQYDTYMQTLLDAFNPAAVAGVMCRNTISVSWEGYLYDCDFNQMLDLKVAGACRHIRDFDLQILEQRRIVLNQHCYGCTAGAGSSCGGQVAS